MATKIASVYKIEYEMSQSLWTVYIAGFTQEEVLNKLYSTTSGINKLGSVQHESRLDSISNQLADEISKPLRIKILELEDELKKVNKVPTSAQPTVEDVKTTNKIGGKIKAGK